MNAGALDLGFVGDAPFSFAAAAGTPMKAVAAFETTGDGEGALSILVRKDSAIRSPVDLAGKRIATTRGSVGHYLLLFVLDKAGIDQSAVSIAFLAPNDGKSALDGGSVDAWSVWDPYVAIAELEGSTRSIANARALYPGFGFLIASDTAIAGKRAQIADFIGPMNRAYDWRRTHVAEFAKVFSAETGLPDAVAVAMLTHTQYRSVPIDDQVVAGVQAIIDVYARHRVVPARVDLSGCFDRSF
jgi:sulfonate transport system substrate-binding protein